MTKINDLLQDIRTELGTDFVSSDVVGMDGLSIGGLQADPDYDTSAASARFAMVMRLAQKVADKVELAEVNDSLVTTEHSYIITRFLGDNSYYWSVVVTREAVLGMVRMVMDEYADPLWDAIPR